MSRASSKLLSAAGAGDSAVYVEDVFSTYLYNGNGSTQNIVNGLDLSGEGGFVWIKARNQSYNHFIFDTARGASATLTTDSTSAEFTTSRISSFNNNGFSLGNDSYANGSGNQYVSWSFRKAKGFFDVQTYTGNGGTAQSVSHDLGCKPGLVIVKRRDSAYNSGVYARNGTNDSEIGTGYLNLTSAFTTSGVAFSANSSSVTIYNSSFNFDATASGGTFVVYFFAMGGTDSAAAVFGEDSDEAIIKCGSYTGNGSTNGPTIDLGFEPQWLFIKNVSSSSNWMMVDNMRGLIVNGDDETLAADGSQAENGVIGNVNAINILPNGWKNVGAPTASNANGDTHFYMAIRRPHKPASEFAATDLFTSANGLNASAGGKAYATTYPVDMHLAKNNNSSSGDWYLRDRLRGGSKYLNPNDPRAESSHSYNNEFDHMDGVYTTTALNNASSIGYSFRRAPEFFDVVTYTGVSSSTVVKHNLGVVPEMVWRKKRDASQGYYVWVSALSGSGNAQANGNFYPTSGMGFANTQYYSGDTQFDNITPPTATQFTQGAFNSSGAKYVAYLFASVAGISKIGTYTGTGNNIDVNCGFSSGARFVMVKSASHGHFYIWDTTRGLVAGSDPYLWLGSNLGQTTGDDYIDPLSTGFTITSSGPTELNSSGVTYAFLAIA